MKMNLIHSMAICLTAFALLIFVACDSQDGLVPEEEGNEKASLYLKIATIDPTATETLPDNEKMHTVRVVVLHDDGTVEHNRHYTLNGAQEETYILLPVTPRETKKIFVFSNEESVEDVEGVTAVGKGRTLSGFFNSYVTGMSGFEGEVTALYYAPDYTGGKNIPMSSEIKKVEVPESGVVDETFHVVRVATKFTINFLNWRREKVTVNRFSIGKYADKNYLMAHVNSYPDSDRYDTWTDWLKAVSDASSADDDSITTERAGWLKDYDLPAQSDKTYTYDTPITIATPGTDESTPGMADIVPDFYLPESMHLKDGESEHGEQEYILTVDIDGIAEPFTCPLPNLKALFRNTNVVVNVTMYRNLELSVDVIPFTSVTLKPDFGLEREDYTGYIVGKDKNGNKCWYDGTEGPYYLGPTDNKESFVTINGKEYLLVYADYKYYNNTKNISGYERTAYNLHHVIEKSTRKKYLLTPEGITGYKYGNDMFINKTKQRVWLDAGGDPDSEKDTDSIYYALKKVGLELSGYRILYEWDRLDWNKARWWGWSDCYPKFWFDILGNRYPWSEGNTEEKRKAKLGDWVKYLE